MSTQTNNDYLLLFRGDAWYDKVPPKNSKKAMGKFKAWFERMAEQNKVKGGQPLLREGTVVSGKNGRVLADGPFAESKEAIGGYCILSVNSLEEAVAIARSHPVLEYGTQIEVRPIAEECPMATRVRQTMQEAQLATA